MTEIPELPDQSYGFTAGFFLIQILILVTWIVLAVVAIRKAAKYTSGAATPIWILLVFLVPFLGSIVTIACVKREGR